MTTLRDLANIPNSHYTLNDWMALAKSCGIHVTADTPLERNQMIALQNKFKESFSAERKQPRSDSEKYEAAMRVMDKLIRENYTFADLSSVLAPAAEKAIDNMLPLLERHKKRLFIPDSVLRELDRMGADLSDPEQARICRERGEALRRMASNGLAQIRRFNNPNGTVAQDLLTACSHFRMTYPLLVLTQDEKLAADLLTLNAQRSADGKSITVKRINKHGSLSNVIETPRPGGKVFRFSVIPRSEEDRPLTVTEVPKNGDYVYNTASRTGPILLGEEIGGGGEGTIYDVGEKYVAKIYKNECCTAHRREKIQKMIDANLFCEGICFPTAMLYNSQGEFVGYMMPKAKGHPLQTSIMRKPLFLKKLPGWDKESLVECVITILYKIKYLHDHGILIGDINQNNFLVVSPKEVYLVDTDSYQIEDLPCPVGTPMYTAPEIHEMHRNGAFSSYTEINRTKENEYFAIATLIFMLLLPGKLPYSHAGGEDIVENILQMHFPYALGEQRGVKVPEGAWRFMWSHLSRKMKDNFHQVFGKGEGKSKFNIKERLDVEQWIAELDIYKKTLQKWKGILEENRPKMEELQQQVERMRQSNDYRLEEAKKEVKRFEANLPDPMSLALHPTRLKRQQGVVYEKCQSEGCTREYPEGDERMKAGFCPECQRKGETVKCLVCDEEFIFSNYEKYYKKYTKSNLCPTCRKQKNDLYYDQPCANPGCSNRVKLTRHSYGLYRAQGEIPKLCPDCRKKPQVETRPASTPTREPVRTPTREPVRTPTRDPIRYPITPGTSSNPPKAPGVPDYPRPAQPRKPPQNPPTPTPSGRKCFITTAVCGYLGKADDCRELMDFRGFRDNWLAHQPGGEAQIREYYECAPELVRKMQASADYEKICAALWENYLVPCHQMIQRNELEQCRVHYTAMVEYLRRTLNS